MADLLRDASGDLLINAQGDLSRATPEQETLQRVLERLRSFAFEWFLDDEGLPYIETLFSVKEPDPQIKTLLILTISETPGVSELLAFEANVDTDTRQLQISFRIQADGGELTGALSLAQPTAASTAVIEDDLASPIRDLLSAPIRDLSA